MTNYDYMCSSPERMAEKIIEIRNGTSGAGREVLDIMYSDDSCHYSDAVRIWLEKEVEQCDT